MTRFLPVLATTVAAVLVGVLFGFTTRVVGTAYAFLFGVLLLLAAALVTVALVGRRWVRR